MTLQQLLSYVRRACDDYQMIQPGDKIAVGISGGKDSLTALTALAALRRFYPVPFSLTAITVDLGFAGFDLTPVAAYCAALQVPYTVLKTDIGTVVFDVRKEKNPCALCAKMRKGALNQAAKKDGVNRIAYGHNRDDMVHTFFLSLLFEGRMHTCAPVTYLDRTDLYCIRPLLYVPEREVTSFAKRQGLPVVKSPCPADGHTKREDVRHMLSELRKTYTHVDEKIFGAIKRAMPDWDENRTE